MSVILDKLNLFPKSTTLHEAIYPSPFHSKRVPTLKVDLERNEWYDHTIEKGGQLIDFVCLYLKMQNESFTLSDALRWVENMAQTPKHKIISFPLDSTVEQKEDNQLILKSKRSIEHLGLIHYLEKQGIPLTVAQTYLTQLYILNKNNRKNFFAVGFVNEDGGYEVRNPFFKGCLRPKSLSFIRGKTPKPVNIHVFKSFWDYLSAVTRNGQPFQADCIVINAYSCLKQISSYLNHYEYQTLYSWMDNTPAGRNATSYLSSTIRSITNLTHKTMNGIYVPHLDVHRWHLSKLSQQV
ncbi:hypothetical protein [Siphonobacter sp. SORGH_AS_1065]|uniref:hypothetical protein n=1 Tax=Siphonobacter sp. SORGH_AS_1065 TaxID=3041795 RepID=UPI0027D7FD04|nr:hypothetical protein [Siphonobacter sp. SORGH_AS_1065]